MDDFDDLENSSKEQLIEKVESLQDEINYLREEKSKAKSNLMWKVRKLEKDKVLIENEKIRLELNHYVQKWIDLDLHLLC